ncbi:hypothetical protein Y032_0085g1817 [Ancylostoma ceylanicum]|uniref:Protein kinase domain-containing protein n=1 Tax=Ancylostoma ceylanicum TaxID=53326 RepID=A0A016TQ12_9BILA|nr:hypothetical protein Y032_0085g1817 [Ancylostoma ceylanicum]
MGVDPKSWGTYPRQSKDVPPRALAVVPRAPYWVPAVYATWFLRNTSYLQVFRASTPQEAIDLISTIIEYTPSARPSPQQACLHAFFDELRMPDTKLPSGRPLPPLEMDGEENRAGHGGHDSAAEQS